MTETELMKQILEDLREENPNWKAEGYKLEEQRGPQGNLEVYLQDSTGTRIRSLTKEQK